MKRNTLKAIAISAVLMLSSQAFAQSLPADTSFTGLFNSVKSEVDPSRMELMVNEMIKKSTGEHDQMLIDASAQTTAVTFAEAGNIAKAKYWLTKVQAAEWKLAAVSDVIRALIESGKIAEAEALTRPIADPVNGKSEFTLTENDRAPFRTLYGVIRYKQGRYKESIPYLIPGNNARIGNHEFYAMALSRSGNIDQAFEEMNKIMRKAAHPGADFLKETRALFIRKKGDDKGFSAIIDSVAGAEAQKTLAKVQKMKVNEPAPDFQVSDFNGRSVSLKSLRGKTVFIDFWATWCVPCVASFPGMQKAVDYYRNDSSVVFMFVHTAEKNANATAEAKKMIAAKKHNFDVFMDLKDQTTGKNPMSSAFGVTFLPTKLVIDPNGIIRYRTAGYIDADEAIPEIKTMIDLARKDSGNP